MGIEGQGTDIEGQGMGIESWALRGKAWALRGIPEFPLLRKLVGQFPLVFSILPSSRDRKIHRANGGHT